LNQSGTKISLGLSEPTPVERPKQFDFIVNLKVANHIGLAIPPNVPTRAERVIAGGASNKVTVGSAQKAVGD